MVGLFSCSLEVYNGVIQYQLAENPHLIYALLSAHKTFEDLGTFTLSHGLREIRRIQLAKEQAQSAEGIKADSPRQSGETNQEKARLLGNTEDESSGLGLTGIPQPEIMSPQIEGSTAQPIVSPTADSIAGESIMQVMSQKARGKMKEERRSASLDGTLERVAAAGVGRNGFVPTQEWV